jgi:hypothetical protein
MLHWAAFRVLATFFKQAVILALSSIVAFSIAARVCRREGSATACKRVLQHFRDVVAALVLKPELQLAIGEERVDLGIALEVFGVPFHAVFDRLGQSSVARLVRMIEPAMPGLPVIHEPICAHFWISADFGLKLHRANGVAGASAGGFADQLGLPTPRC